MKYIIIMLTLINFFTLKLHGTCELEAVKIELIEVAPDDIRLIAFFKYSTITTYFKKSYRKKNFFFSMVPIKQEFLCCSTKQTFTTVKYQCRLWDDGVSGYSFVYDDIDLKIGDEKFNHIFVTLNDQSCDAAFEMRYTLSFSATQR